MSIGRGLHLYTGNRLETLFVAFSKVVAQPVGSIFRPETVVVQSAGMGRWLSLRLAEAQGVCANVDFPFPRRFVADVSKEMLPDMTAADSFDRELMTWRIRSILPSLLERREFEQVRHYLDGQRSALKLYQLAVRIAEVFDRYLVFRPQMILTWDSGKETHWQAILWRELSKDNSALHPPALAKNLTERLNSGDVPLGKLPPRVSLFGISTLPPFYLQIIEPLAAHTEIHLFVLEPTPEWWHDLVTPRQASRMLHSQPGLTAEELHLEGGNPLLASMGKLGRDFLGLIAELEPARHHELFEEPNGLTTLSSLQRDIYSLRDRHAESNPFPDDDTIQFHSCHSPMREIEVLHDQLLAAFEGDGSLEPRDVIVMMPDVVSYAPFIDAVFGSPEDERYRIPFTIADRSSRGQSGVVESFLSLLELSGSRFAVDEVLKLLESPAIQQRFNLAPADIEVIRSLIIKAGIRWGIDADHRQSLGLPAFSQNTWREGLDRLLLGYALPAAGTHLFRGLLPVDEVEGDRAEILGNLTDFLEALFEIASQCQIPRPLQDWQSFLRCTVDRVFGSNEQFVRELLPVRRVLESLGEAGRIDPADAIPFDVLLAHVTRVLDASDDGAGFLVGRVTFCALKPLRSIPFKVVCLLGMNDTAYPRKSSSSSFDLMAEKPRPGDRSMRDDDRYLFLEALLSARQLFYVSYVGQSIRDNSPQPPSVLVSQLLDVVAGSGSGSSLVTRHRLQPFSADYFRKGSALFSYSAENCRAAAIGELPRSEPPPFFQEAGSEARDEPVEVDLETMIRFFSQPAKFFLRETVGIQLPIDEQTLEAREPFEFAGLPRYGVEQFLFARGLAGLSLEADEALIRATSQLPAGNVGGLAYDGACQKVQRFVQLVQEYGAEEARPSVQIEVDIGRFKLTGVIDHLTNRGLVRARLTTLKGKDVVRIWISLLALNTVEPTEGVLLADGLVQRYRPVKQSQVLLQELLAIYSRGLREPLPFFPDTSLRFACQHFKSARDPRGDAVKIWEGNRFQGKPGEKDNPYIELAFRGRPEPLDQEWERLSIQVYSPALAHQEEIEASL